MPIEEALSAADQQFLDNDKASDADTKEALRVEKLGTDSAAAPAPAPTPAPTPTQPGATPAPTQKADDKENLVPHGALHEERERRKAAEQLAAKAAERFDKLAELITPKPTPAPTQAPIDADKDPLGALKMTLEEVKELKNFSDTQKQRQRDAAALKELGDKAAGLELDYLRTMPDFDEKRGKSPEYEEACNYMKAGRAAELAALGYKPQQIESQLIQDALILGSMAIAEGKNPAESVMKLAKARGFNYKKADPANPPAGEMTEAQKIELAARGQKANKSLSDGGGNSPGEQITGASIAKMSDAQFEAYYDKIQKDPAKMREIFGA